MSKKAAKRAAQAEAAQAKPGPKALVLTPQIAVCIQGVFPDQELFVERPNASGTRHKVQLTQDNAYNILMDLLAEKAGAIELERQLAAERAAQPARKRAQPDWRLIAKHPEATIIERLPTKSPQLSSTKAELNLEEMGL